MLPIIPIRTSIYPGLLISDEWVHVIKDEPAYSTMAITEEVFLSLCNISSTDDLMHYQHEHLEQRFIIAESGYIAQDEYFAKAFREMETLKATNGLVALYDSLPESIAGPLEREYEIALYINNHDCLQEVLGYDIMDVADTCVGVKTEHIYQDDYYAVNLIRDLYNALDSLGCQLQRTYLKAEPYQTIVAAMWGYGFFRHSQETTYKKCEKPGCKN